jgi:hypothetical protein
MRYGKDKVSDVLAVLALMKWEIKKTSYYRDARDLRLEAVKEVAENEFRANRYKNLNSAFKTIHDACARRLRPDVGNITDFDRIANQCLRHNSTELRDILLRHSANYSQKVAVNNFF